MARAASLGINGWPALTGDAVDALVLEAALDRAEEIRKVRDDNLAYAIGTRIGQLFGAQE